MILSMILDSTLHRVHIIIDYLFYLKFLKNIRIVFLFTIMSYFIVIVLKKRGCL
jgi:hypothetical protein